MGVVPFGLDVPKNPVFMRALKKVCLSFMKNTPFSVPSYFQGLSGFFFINHFFTTAGAAVVFELYHAFLTFFVCAISSKIIIKLEKSNAIL